MQTLLFLLIIISFPLANSNLNPGIGLNCHPPPEPAGRLWSPCMPPRIFHIMQLSHFVITYLGDGQFNFTYHWTTSTMRKKPVHSCHFLRQWLALIRLSVNIQGMNQVQSLLIFCEVCICKFFYWLIFICNSQLVLMGLSWSVTDTCRAVKTLECPDVHTSN